MEFEDEVNVDVSAEKVFEFLSDLNKVASCMPGANLEDVKDDIYHGSIKIKVGPVSVTYRGTAKWLELDSKNRILSIEAKGKEARGAGTASAIVTASIRDKSSDSMQNATSIAVKTKLIISGRVAQLSRNVLADVSAKLLTEFSRNLELDISKFEEAAEIIDISTALNVRKSTLGVENFGDGEERHLGSQVTKMERKSNDSIGDSASVNLLRDDNGYEIRDREAFNLIDTSLFKDPKLLVGVGIMILFVVAIAIKARKRSS